MEKSNYPLSTEKSAWSEYEDLRCDHKTTFILSQTSLCAEKQLDNFGTSLRISAIQQQPTTQQQI